MPQEGQREASLRQDALLHPGQDGGQVGGDEAPKADCLQK